MMIKNNENKKMYGQFFTVANPFNCSIFFDWFDLIPEKMKQTIYEPFAGSNNIVKMVSDLLNFYNLNWKCFDISPNSYNTMPTIPIVKRDTIKSFPNEAHVIITNPPYLAKNSATRNHLNFPNTTYDDLYKVCTDIMLKNGDYIAAIIPESFINSELFHNRLFAFVSLTCKMFNDTDCPVCLALFIPEFQKKCINLEKNDFFIYSQNNFIGTYNELNGYRNNLKKSPTIEWKFNNPIGNIGIKCVDNTNTSSIKFILGNEISSNKIKISSRATTRVSGLPEDIDINKFLDKCNDILEKYRVDTYDVFLTSFKGLRIDNMYRRRLDFKTAKIIMNSAVSELRKRGALND